MTQEQINYYSELMAKFLEFDPCTDDECKDDRCYYVSFDHGYKNASSMKFHTDRNWLHRVWEKFRDLKFDDASDDVFGRHYSFKNTVAYCITYSAITEVFIEIGKAIEWYNSLKK